MRRPLETNRISRFSRLGCLRTHRFSDSAASAEASPNSGLDDVAFSLSEQDRHSEVMISELNGWRGFPLTDATPATSPSPAYGSRPEQLANFSLQDFFYIPIPYPKPVYPGAFSDPFFVSDFTADLHQVVHAKVSKAMSVEIE